MSNSLFVLVRPKKGGRERHITKRAYQLAQNKWELIQGQEAQVTLPIQKKSEAAAVVANAEIEAISFEKESTEQKSTIHEDISPVEQPKKRGRKPKQV